MEASKRNFLTDPQQIHFYKRKTLKNLFTLKESRLNSDVILGHYKLSIFNGIFGKWYLQNTYHHSIQSKDMRIFHPFLFSFLFVRECYHMLSNDLLYHMSYSRNCMADIILKKYQENVFLRRRICLKIDQRLLVFLCHNVRKVWLQTVMLNYNSAGITRHTVYFHKWWDYWDIIDMKKQFLNQQRENLLAN